MAILNLSITIPDAHVPRVIAGLRGHWGKVEDPAGSGVFRERTQAELVALLRQLVRDTVGNIVTNQEASAAVKSVTSSYDEIGVS